MTGTLHLVDAPDVDRGAADATTPSAEPPPFVAHPRRVQKRSRGAQRAWEFARDDEGAVTAEYAIIIMAAVAFAGVLVAILRSPEVRGMLVDLVEKALSAAG